MEDAEILLVGELQREAPEPAAGESIRVAAVTRVPDLAAVRARLGKSARGIFVEGKGLLPELAREEEVRQAESARVRELERQSRERGLMIAQVLHDIRGGLTVVRGYAGILEKLPADCRKTRSSVEQIIKTAGDLNGLLEELLLMSQCEAGRLQLHLTETRIREEIQSVLEAHRLQAQAKGLSLESRFAPSVPEVLRTDVLRLRRMIGNLLANAVKFTESGGVIVDVTCENGIFGITVTDSGPGVPAEFHEAIFEPFEQGGVAAQARFGGSGLGLSAVRRLARLMGGDVALVRSAPGSGSVFRLTVSVDPVEETQDSGA